MSTPPVVPPDPTAEPAGCAIVTGASRGFGRGIARALAERGYPVVLAARGEADLHAAADELRAAGAEAVPFVADVRSEADVDALIGFALERFGAIDVLVNNAGAPALMTELDAMDFDEWRRNIDVDVRGIFNTVRRVAAPMRSRGRGTIVNVASGAAVVAGPLHVSYAPAQATIVSLSRSIAAWLAPAGVVVHTLSPTISPQGGVGLAGATRFAAEEGIAVDDWFARRGPILEADAVGAAVAALVAEPEAATWHVDAGGLVQWDMVVPAPVPAGR
jgi:NAD(P)-dependent dehydrogenase (short-subunit alcohol dehydrogenase family)